MKKKDKIVMDQYATGEIKAVEPSKERPKMVMLEWEEYYTKAVDLIEKKFSHRNRQWCHDQLNRALDNTEFHHVDDYELQCQMIDEILVGEFGIYTQNPYIDWAEDSIGDALFELREWIVEQWLNEKSEYDEGMIEELEGISKGFFDQYKKYNLLQDAMEILNEKESD